MNKKVIIGITASVLVVGAIIGTATHKIKVEKARIDAVKLEAAKVEKQISAIDKVDLSDKENIEKAKAA